MRTHLPQTMRHRFRSFPGRQQLMKVGNLFRSYSAAKQAAATMYFKCSEKDVTLDKFVLSLASRSAFHSGYLHVVSGSSSLNNYVLLMRESEEGKPNLSLLEYRISIEDYKHVSSREHAINELIKLLPDETLQASNVKRYLILKNYSSSDDAESDVTILHKNDVSNQRPGSYLDKLYALLQAIRLDPTLGRENLYDMSLKIGDEQKTVRQLLLAEYDDEPAEGPAETYYPVVPVVKNGMSLLELYEYTRDPSADLGVFLIREPTKRELITHIKPARELSEITPDTNFIVSDTISYEELCRLRPAVHEVIYRENYGLVYWQRSSVPTANLRQFLTCSSPDHYEQCPPPTGWLNVIHADRTSGKSSFLQYLERKFHRDKPFSLVKIVDGCSLSETLAACQRTTLERLGSLFGMKSAVEMNVLEVLAKRGDEVMLLFDDVDHVGDLLVQFLGEVQKCFGTCLKVWVAASDELRTLVEATFPIVSHEFPELDKIEQAEFLETLLPKLNAKDIEDILMSARTSNKHELLNDFVVGFPFVKNAFHLKLVADICLRNANSARSFYILDLLDHFVAIYQLNDVDLEEKCYKFRVGDSFDTTIVRRCRQSTVIDYLAAKYLSKHAGLVDLSLFYDHNSIAGFFDQIQARENKLLEAVLHNDTELVLSTIDSYKESLDILQRNPLHLAQNCLAIQEVLVKAGLRLEQPCLLSNYTPLQLADKRHDWPFVDLLLRHGANDDFPDLQLRTMSNKKLTQVLDKCISYDLRCLTEWILNNRPDLHITQQLVYSLSVNAALDWSTKLRILNVAYDQRLHERDPEPYRFMWGNTALHEAAHNGHLELCQFLVEKLTFPVDLRDYNLNTPLHDANDSAVVAFLKGSAVCELEEAQDEQSEPAECESLFTRACNSGNLDLVRFAVEEEGHDCLASERGSYGFITAAAWGHLGIVEYLFEKGFKQQLDIEDTTGYTALATAVRNTQLPVIEFLVAKGARVDTILDNPSDEKVRKFLTEHCGYVTPITFEYLASLNLEKLRAVDFDFSTENEDGEVFLHYYVTNYDDSEILKFLLTKYEDINMESKFTGRTPLLEALLSNHVQAVDTLLKAGADVHKHCAKTGQNVLHFCTGNKRLMDLFLSEYNLGINSRDNSGRTIVFFLNSSLANASWVSQLVERYGMDVNAQDNEGHTVLHKTVIQKSYFCLNELEFLLKVAGVCQDVTDHRGRLALHYAAEAGQLKEIQLMKRYGLLEWHLRDKQGKSSVDLASEGAHEGIVSFFKELECEY